MKSFPKWMYVLWIILVISMAGQIVINWNSNSPIVWLNVIGIVVIVILLISNKRQKVQ